MQIPDFDILLARWLSSTEQPSDGTIQYGHMDGLHIDPGYRPEVQVVGHAIPTHTDHFLP